MVSSVTHKLAQIARPLRWLFVVCLLIQGPSPGVVLCFGANGHVAAEVPHSRYPHPASQSQGPCLDLPLISVSSTEHPLVLAPPATPHRGIPVAVSATVCLPLYAAAIPERVSHPLPASTPLLVWLKTLVLLI
jgi:hypothetical protein